MSDGLRLDGGGDTLILGVRGGRPYLDYWGPELPLGEALDPRLLERAVPHGMLDAGEALDLFPQSGHGFTGQPAIEFSRPNGGFISQMAFDRSEAVADGVRLILVDPLAGVEVELKVTLDAGTAVVGFQTLVRSVSSQPLRLEWVSPIALTTPHDELMTFAGRWGREFTTHRQRLAAGAWSSASRTGRTSHHAPPFLIVGEPGFSERTGEVLGLHLAWSGDHRLICERTRDGRIQVQAGELFWPGEVVLARGETYETPWLYAVRSQTGLQGLTDRFQAFVRDHVLAGRLTAKPRPIHFNTWEAVYFRHDLEELKALASLAAEVGAERFVLDDGWFRGRDHDRAGLGDWTPDIRKYPNGLTPLADHVRSLGLEFGLWVEPEMANGDSDLLRAHPDWVLGKPSRRQPLGRGQYVLDLTRPEVSENIFGQLDTLLSENPIDYLKWDMNRDLTHPASGGRPASRAQVKAVYALLDRVRAAHPGVEIESCASGGGRADYEILRRTDRIWTSDCNDPIERQSIQDAFSIFFPPEVMGSHVGPADSHTTARSASLDLRAHTSLFGHMGIEADLREFDAKDLAALKAALALHKDLRGLLHGGRRLRQVAPDPGAVAFMVLGERAALASLAQLETPRFGVTPNLRLQGLNPELRYAVKLLNPPKRPAATMKVAPAFVTGEKIEATGQAIATVGIPMPVLRAGEIAIVQLTACET